jgi:hypothetical protein
MLFQIVFLFALYLSYAQADYLQTYLYANGSCDSLMEVIIPGVRVEHCYHIGDDEYIYYTCNSTSGSAVTYNNKYCNGTEFSSISYDSTDFECHFSDVHDQYAKVNCSTEVPDEPYYEAVAYRGDNCTENTITTTYYFLDTCFEREDGYEYASEMYVENGNSGNLILRKFDDSDCAGSYNTTTKVEAGCDDSTLVYGEMIEEEDDTSSSSATTTDDAAASNDDAEESDDGEEEEEDDSEEDDSNTSSVSSATVVIIFVVFSVAGFMGYRYYDSQKYEGYTPIQERSGEFKSVDEDF